MGNNNAIPVSKIFLVTILTLFLPAMIWAAVAIETAIISGNVVQVEASHALHLDNGQTYYPSRKGLAPGVQVGQPVTLRYYVEGGEKNVFFEHAPGADSLKKTRPTSSRKNSGPH